MKNKSIDNNNYELLNDLISNISDAVYFKDLSGKLIYVNSGHSKGLGLKAEEVIGKTDFDFFPKEQAEQMTNDDKLVIENRQSLEGIIEYTTRPDGSRHYVSTTKLPRFDKNGNVIGIMGITRDITSQKDLLDKLKSNEEKFRLTFESSKDAIFWVNPETGILINCNKAAEELTGYNRNEIIGKNHTFLYQKNDNKKYNQMFYKQIKSSGTFEEYAEIQTKNSKTKYVLITSSLIKSEFNNFLQGVFHDVTLRIKTENELKLSENRFQQVIESAREWVWEVDRSGKFTYSSDIVSKIIGYSSPEILTMNYCDILHPEMKEFHSKKIYNYLNNGNGFRNLIKKVLHKDGALVWLSSSATPYYDDRGTLLGFRGVDINITAQKKAEDELNKIKINLEVEKQKLEQVLNIDREISSILDLNNLVDFVIEKATEILEVEKCSLMLVDEESNELIIKGAIGLDRKIIEKVRIKVGDDIAGFVAKEGRPLLVNNIESNDIIGRTNRSNYKFKSFMSVPIKLHNKLVGVVNVADKNGFANDHFSSIDLKILSTIVRQAAIAIENAHYYRELEYLSISDSLTGIYNHRHFMNALENEIQRSIRYERSLCLLMIDIDNFKNYNDTYGHLAGDNLLKNYSKIFKDNSRTVDIVCRYAGDEFVIILPETNLTQAKIVANKILLSVNNLKIDPFISVSIGIAKLNNGDDKRDLIMRADQALYEAKDKGKNNFISIN